MEGMLSIGIALDYLDAVIKPLTDSIRPVVLPGVLNIVPVPAKGVCHMAYPFVIGIAVDIIKSIIGKIDMSEPKFHHRIPQTYLKAWCYNSNSVWYYNKENQTSEKRNISKIMGVNYFHSIKAGSIFTTQESLEKIFAPLNGYAVYEKTDEGNEMFLSSRDLMNQRFHNYENWIIKESDGKVITAKQKKIIKGEIDKISDNSIEEAWDKKYENAWKNTITEIQQTVIDIHEKNLIMLTDTAYHTIIDYFVMFQWRSTSGYDKAREAFDWFISIIPEIMNMDIDDDVHRENKTIADNMWHNYLLSQYHNFLNGDGVMSFESKQYFEKLTPLFMIDRTGSIITSDNPCFTFTNKDGYQEPILVALPSMIISLARKNPNALNEYRICEMNDEDVDYYNRIIFGNGNEIISKNLIDVTKLEECE